MFTDTGGAKSWLWKSRVGSGLACLPWEWSQGFCPEVLMGLGWSAGQGKAPPGCCSAKEMQVALPGWGEWRRCHGRDHGNVGARLKSLDSTLWALQSH